MNLVDGSCTVWRWWRSGWKCSPEKMRYLGSKQVSEFVGDSPDSFSHRGSSLLQHVLHQGSCVDRGTGACKGRLRCECGVRDTSTRTAAGLCVRLDGLLQQISQRLSRSHGAACRCFGATRTWPDALG